MQPRPPADIQFFNYVRVGGRAATTNNTNQRVALAWSELQAESVPAVTIDYDADKRHIGLSCCLTEKAKRGQNQEDSQAKLKRPHSPPPRLRAEYAFSSARLCNRGG